MDTIGDAYIVAGLLPPARHRRRAASCVITEDPGNCLRRRSFDSGSQAAFTAATDARNCWLGGRKRGMSITSAWLDYMAHRDSDEDQDDEDMRRVCERLLKVISKVSPSMCITMPHKMTGKTSGSVYFQIEVLDWCEIQKTVDRAKTPAFE